MNPTVRLSTLLKAKCEADGLTFQQASEIMGQSPNAVSRWVRLTIFPGPAQYRVIADFLGISVGEVGAALAYDQLAKADALSRAQS
jgi:transcriptional regulator with XRE-family HTH domain